MPRQPSQILLRLLPSLMQLSRLRRSNLTNRPSLKQPSSRSPQLSRMQNRSSQQI